MDTKRPSFSTRLSKIVRNLLMVAVVVVGILLVTADKNTNFGNPFAIPEANADFISAAPSFLTMSVSAGGGNFYIIDSGKQVICVYQLDGEKIRLVSARDFKRDSDIFDSSISLPGLRGRDGKRIQIEKGKGVDAADAAIYADALNKYLENYEKQRLKRR